MLLGSELVAIMWEVLGSELVSIVKELLGIVSELPGSGLLNLTVSLSFWLSTGTFLLRCLCYLLS